MARTKKEEGHNEGNILSNQAKIEQYLLQKYDFRFNTIKKDVFYRSKPEHQGEAPGDWEEVNLNDVLRDLLLKGHKCSRANLEATLYSKFCPQYNPFKEYFDNLKEWDGVDYLQQICNCIVLVNETEAEIKRLYTQLKKWLVRALRCLFGGMINREVIMFKSDAQKIGKTQFFRYLTPPSLNGYYMENPDVSNKDALISLTENFIINLDEYDKYLKEGALPVLKSYISQDAPKVRAPYDSKQRQIKRVCSFVASTNINDFLRDETGNTRYICFDISGFEWKKPSGYTRVSVEDLWSQIYWLYEQSEKGAFNCDMTDEEATENDANNLNYTYQSTEFELLQRYFEPDENNFMMCTEIAERLADLARFRITTNAVGRALTQLGYSRRYKIGDNSKKGYYINVKNII